jgi:lipopolysaccharide export system protein LptC
MSWRSVVGLVLLVAAVLSGWSAWKHRQVPARAGVGADRSDYVMNDFELTALDEDGKESVTLRAPEMHRSPADQSFSITTPLFLMPDAEGKYWQMRSKTGWLSAKGEELRLTGDVRGTSPDDAVQPTVFETQRLNVFPSDHLAITDDNVRITQPGSILTGRGFETNLETKQYTIKSQVKSRYEPRSAR